MLLNGRRLDDMNLILLGIHDTTRRYETERALRASEDRLSEENRNKDEYLAMLGHELRNPLGALRNATEVLRRSSPGDPRLRRAYGVLERQTAHMSRIIDGLLDVSRIARGKINLDSRAVELGDLLDRLLEVSKLHSDARGLELETDFAPEPLWVMGDDARLTQVFDNIIGNAIKFTEAPGTITLELARERSSVVVRVRDTGVGIHEAILPHLFETFRQGTQDPARTSGGLGLGLALAKGLIELHHGVIEVYSAGPGQGAEFKVRLPLCSAPVELPERDPCADKRARHVLIVEDNDDAAQMLSALLQLEGHDTAIVANGPEALDHLRARGADVVFCDLGLPGMSGDELARAIRRDAALREMPLIALTGYGQPDDRKRTAEAGFDEHIVKPVDTGTLNAIFDWLDSRDEQQ